MLIIGRKFVNKALRTGVEVTKSKQPPELRNLGKYQMAEFWLMLQLAIQKDAVLFHFI